MNSGFSGFIRVSAKVGFVTCIAGNSFPFSPTNTARTSMLRSESVFIIGLSSNFGISFSIMSGVRFRPSRENFSRAALTSGLNSSFGKHDSTLLHVYAISEEDGLYNCFGFVLVVRLFRVLNFQNFPFAGLHFSLRPSAPPARRKAVSDGRN